MKDFRWEVTSKMANSTFGIAPSTSELSSKHVLFSTIEMHMTCLSIVMILSVTIIISSFVYPKRTSVLQEPQWGDVD